MEKVPDLVDSGSGSARWMSKEEEGEAEGAHAVAREEEEVLPNVYALGHARAGPKKRSSDVIVRGKDQNVEFKDLDISDDILKGLQLCRFEKPTPIQLSAIPLGKLHRDLLLQAKSGTGKTCVFTVCILQEVIVTDKFIQALVLAPSREIAVQICFVLKSIGAFKDGLKIKEFIGGTSVSKSLKRIRNAHIAVGTPGRVAHMIQDFNMDLSKVRVFAMDEADKLMESSFFNDLQVIFDALPVEKQMIVASATYSDTTVQFLEKFMRSPCRIQLDLKNPALCAVDQYVVDVKKVMGAVGIPQSEEAFRIKFNCLKEVLKRVRYTQCVIFSNWQLRAEKLYEEFKDLDLDVVLLSGARSQEDRLDAYTQLQKGKCRLMIATDVASRGIDVEGLDLVVNFDIPTDGDTYMHRVGRAGRFGSSGIAVSMCSFQFEHKIMVEFQAAINFTVWMIETLEDIKGLDDHLLTVQKFRQLKGVKEPVHTSQPGLENYHENAKICRAVTVENNPLELIGVASYRIGMTSEQSMAYLADMDDIFTKAQEARKKRVDDMKTKITEEISEQEEAGADRDGECEDDCDSIGTEEDDSDKED